jgi:hypothetical protein
MDALPSTLNEVSRGRCKESLRWSGSRNRRCRRRRDRMRCEAPGTRLSNLMKNCIPVGRGPKESIAAPWGP